MKSSWNPQIGRFINADDPELSGLSADVLGVNLFTYCFNNPANYYDPDGRFAITLTIKSGAALAKLIIGAMVVTAAAIILSDSAVQRALSNAISALGKWNQIPLRISNKSNQ